MPIDSLHTLAAMLGAIALLWWGVMLVFQGEGVELDTLRRRHPMWEWLFSHPVPPGPVFLAEMLSPLVANPTYYSAPVLPGVLYGSVYGAWYGAIAALLIGVPITCAAACLGKALEIGVMLRLPPRSRGAMLGLMSWLGYGSMLLLFFGASVVDKVAKALAGVLEPLTAIPWPWLSVFLGQTAGGSFSFPLGVAACWSSAAVVIVGSVAFSIWGTQRGLSGAFTLTEPAREATTRGFRRFGKDPVYRKELLWFARDRSALVQAFLIPLTIVGFQLINLRGVVSEAQVSWNLLCGAAVLFGTSFFSMLGPRSLASEGNALWIALTWPRGLESLLKAKAQLWTWLASAIVGLVFCYAVYLFPASWWKILLVGVAWLPFARSMADKAVTLATVTSGSGEMQQVSIGRRWAVQLGMLTFSIGVLTGQWALAATGIVYSIITAAAMWQNFRARLPYLYDRWSETLPTPPTLMHAMIAISIMVEVGAVVSGFAALAGPQWVALARAVMYGISAGIVSVAVAMFLRGRGVPMAEIWHWQDTEPNSAQSRRWWALNPGSGNFWLLSSMLAGIGLGFLLGLFGQGYVRVLHYFPSAAELLDRSEAQFAAIPHLRISLLAMSVLIAPIAEEYLFRGLLYRALDREWGGWRAAVGSAAFFAVYHPFLAWLPVGTLGFVNAVLFKKTGRLAPAVAVHMVYNFIVLL